MHTVRHKNSCFIKHDALWPRALLLLQIPDVGNIHVLPARDSVFLDGNPRSQRVQVCCCRPESKREVTPVPLNMQTKTHIKNKLLPSVSVFNHVFLHCGCEPRGRAIERLSSQPFLSSPCPKLTLMKDKPKQEKIMHAAPRTAPLQSPDPLVPEVAAADLHSTSHPWISNLGLTFQKENNSFQNYDFLCVQNRPKEVLMKRSEAESTV